MVKPFYCYLCGWRHVSEHKHKVSPDHFPTLLSRFDKVPAVAKLLTRTEEIHVCCLWLKEGHTKYGRIEFRASEPVREHALAFDKRRPDAVDRSAPVVEKPPTVESLHVG